MTHHSDDLTYHRRRDLGNLLLFVATMVCLFGLAVAWYASWALPDDFDGSVNLPRPGAKLMRSCCARRTWIAAAAVACAPLLWAVASSAHVFRNGDPDCPREAEHCPREWYFNGAIYHSRQDAADDHPSDPLSVIFKGGRSTVGPSGQCDRSTGDQGVDDACVFWHMDVDWPKMHTPPKPFGKTCDTPAYLVYRNLITSSRLDPSTDTVLRDRGMSTGRRVCSTQYHIRMWDDRAHAAHTNHGDRNQWVLGAIHHERREVFSLKPSFSHHLDMDWIDVRAHLRKEMAEHCSRRRWAYHPGAEGNLQNKESDGIILRISLSHASTGPGTNRCEGQ